MANKTTTIKLKKGSGSWQQVYGNEINNRLRKDKDLSDVNDKAESRKNLEIIGDNNTTHYHDSRYMPKIDAEIAERKKADAEIQKDLAREITDRKSDSQKISKAIVDSENRINASMANTKNELNTNMNTIQSTLTSKMSDIKTEVQRSDVGTKTISIPGGLNKSSNMTISQSFRINNPNSNNDWHNPYLDGKKIYITKDNIASGTYTIEELLNKLSEASHIHEKTISQCTLNCNCNCNCHSSNSH